MGTVSFSVPPTRWAIGPIDFKAADLLRLAEFFDDSIEQVGTIIRSVWMPDASRTLQALAHDCAAAPESRLIFLCDHLREGARSVGAAAIAHAADLMECAVRDGKREAVQALVTASIARVCQLSLSLAA